MRSLGVLLKKSLINQTKGAGMISKNMLGVTVVLATLTFMAGCGAAKSSSGNYDQLAYKAAWNKTALRELRDAARQNIAPAEYHMAVIYAYGSGVPRNKTKASIWIKKAISSYTTEANDGNGDAAYHLGYIYEAGLAGVTTDPDKASLWYAKAARDYRSAAGKGSIVSEYNLGYSYFLGKGVDQDYHQALNWFMKSAKHDYAPAELIIGLMYHHGEGVHKDDMESAYWIAKAARAGNRQAQYTLGLMYGNGQGVSQNNSKAVKWYRKSAKQHYPQAEVALGYLYFFGYGGVHKEKSRAQKFWSEVTHQGLMQVSVTVAIKNINVTITAQDGLSQLLVDGYSSAAYPLGSAWEFGYGAKRHLITALAVYKMGELSESGQKDKRLESAIQNIEKKLKSAEVKKAHRLAKEWLNARKNYLPAY